VSAFQLLAAAVRADFILCIIISVFVSEKADSTIASSWLAHYHKLFKHYPHYNSTVQRLSFRLSFICAQGA
jgi:hypothetical protein